MISVSGLTKSFQEKKRGTVRAVDNLSFECRPGQVFGLLGLNGAGKTTTLRILATSNLRGGESTGLYLRLTGRETLRYFGGLQGLSLKVVDERIERFTHVLDMGTFLDARVDTYSTGMKQKVSIARARSSSDSAAAHSG